MGLKMLSGLKQQYSNPLEEMNAHWFDTLRFRNLDYVDAKCNYYNIYNLFILILSMLMFAGRQ